MQENTYIDLTLPRQKHIALVAHDNKKKDMIEWCKEHAEVLGQHFLCGTGTTARLITDATKLPVRAFNSGPLGGDLQIGARIVENAIDCMIFFWDPLAAQPHDPDVKAIMRIAAVYDIPCAFNRSSADFLLSSRFMDDAYTHKVMNFTQNVLGRVETMKE